MSKEHHPRRQIIIDADKLFERRKRKFFTETAIIEASEKRRHGIIILPPLPPSTNLTREFAKKGDQYLIDAFKELKKRKTLRRKKI